MQNITNVPANYGQRAEISDFVRIGWLVHQMCQPLNRQSQSRAEAYINTLEPQAVAVYDEDGAYNQRLPSSFFFFFTRHRVQGSSGDPKRDLPL